MVFMVVRVGGIYNFEIPYQIITRTVSPLVSYTVRYSLKYFIQKTDKIYMYYKELGLGGKREKIR